MAASAAETGDDPDSGIGIFLGTPAADTNDSGNTATILANQGRQFWQSSDGEDPFRRLPDELLRHVLSFLQSDHALQTCVLDTRWRDLWRRETTLNLNSYDYGLKREAWKRFKRIVNLVIKVRGNSPLKCCVLTSFSGDKDAELWVKYALTCQVKCLKVTSDYLGLPVRYDDAPFISQHLKILNFFNAKFQGSSLDFSNCPALHNLKMAHCFIHASTISSESLKHLCITTFSKFPRDSHVRIVAPNLITLQLDGFEGLTPSLGHMQSLIEAYVGLSSDCGDFCSINGQGCEDQHCACHAYPAGEGVLLNGLSSAVSLELIGNTKTFIYRWDLKWCPIFEKLKTLLLNEWFRAIDLVCILQHSPILEMLTLQLGNTENLVGATGVEEAMEQSFVCAHLKVVNIECKEVDAGVHKILTILRTCGILRDHISIKALSSPSYYFSFQKDKA